MIRAEIISIGTELLLGDIINTNASFLAKELAVLGVGVYHQTVVGDNRLRLKQAIEEAFSRSDLIITSGGLGPTYDDITKQVFADYFGLDMVMNKDVLLKIESFFKKSGLEMSENNKIQAMIPEGAKILTNDRGTAPGISIKQGGKWAILLPGPPIEMEPMFLEEVKPLFQNTNHSVIASHTLRIFGMGESTVESILRDRMVTMTNPTIAPYAKLGEVELRLTALADTNEEAEKLLKPVLKETTNLLKEVVYGMDVSSLEEALVLGLIEKGKTISTAESCTGGLISERITRVSGSSQVFGYGVCSYANKAKEKILGVNEKTIQQYGAVSPEVALEMAKGIRSLSGSDIGISTTGIAGPTGGSVEKPVGLVYIGVVTEKESYVKKLMLSRNYKDERDRIRYLAASNALHLALNQLKKESEQ